MQRAKNPRPEPLLSRASKLKTAEQNETLEVRAYMYHTTVCRRSMIGSINPSSFYFS